MDKVRLKGIDEIDFNKNNANFHDCYEIALKHLGRRKIYYIKPASYRNETVYVFDKKKDFYINNGFTCFREFFNILK